MKVFIVGRDMNVEKMFKDAGHETFFDLSKKPDLAVFTGGADVTPFLYGQATMPGTYCDYARDKREVAIFKDLPKGLPKVGICRGGQFLNVMCGGTLWQDVDAHAISGTHVAFDHITGEVLNVTSTHHQQMLPSTDAEIIVTADLCSRKENEFSIWKRRGKEDEADDIEVCYYSDFSALCYQPHPEYSHSGTREHFFRTLGLLFDTATVG